jgi:Fe-S-cluster containining protein
MNPITELHQTIDAYTAKLAEASAKAGRPITCAGKGCCHCCYEPVYCSDAEVKHILEGMSDIQKWALSADIHTAIDAARESGLFDKYMPPVMDWLSLKLPCPFLNRKEGTCSVYDRRPLSCRAHIAVGPPDWCRDRRMEQTYPGADEVSIAIAEAIVHFHSKLGNVITHDNLLSLLEGELLGEYHPTASSQQIVFEKD